VWTGEILGERLGQCAGLVIRWRRAVVRNVEGGRSSTVESSEGQNFSFPAIVQLGSEFEEDGISNDGSSGPSNPEVLISGAGSTSPNHHPHTLLQTRFPLWMVFHLVDRAERIPCVIVTVGQQYYGGGECISKNK
jgi:hypothetical protein